MPEPTLEFTTPYATIRIYAQMECANGHTFLAEPGDTTGINCPQCDENGKAAHEQTNLAPAHMPDLTPYGATWQPDIESIDDLAEIIVRGLRTRGCPIAENLLDSDEEPEGIAEHWLCLQSDKCHAHA